MRDFTKEPAWEAKDLGQPLPDSPHACSVCLPTWDSVVGYEESRDKVIRKLRAGYPRFFLASSVRSLFEAAETNLGRAGERVLVFPTQESAQRAQRFVELRHSSATRITSFEGLQALAVNEEAYLTALLYWRYTGEVISSRQAEDILRHESAVEDAGESLHSYMADQFSCSESDLFLYETGMSACFAIHRVLTTLTPAKKTLQLDFPYVDTLKVQENFGSGVVFLPQASGEHFDEALARIRQGEFAAIFCEFPSNPLLSTVDIIKLSEAARQGHTPLIADDTVCSHYNVDIMAYVDVISTSLTKWISGKGDVAGGALRVNPDSPFAEALIASLEEANPTHSRIYSSDAHVLKQNAEGFVERMKLVNHNGEALANYLSEHPAIDQVWYPSLENKNLYDVIRREEGGYGGLLSFTLKNEKKAPKVYDTLMWNKGPSLGTEFSLACPYTLLAHYHELDWAAGCGVSANLIRLSVGIEDCDTLLASLKSALEQA